MTVQSKLSNILLAAALGATSAVHAADEQNNDRSAQAAAAASANSSAINTTENTNNTINVINPPAQRKIIHQPDPVILKGLFTDTAIAFKVYEVKESEFEESQTVPQISDVVASTNASASVSANVPAGAWKQVINTYEEVEVCKGNIFYVQCEGTRTKKQDLARPAPKDGPQ